MISKDYYFLQQGYEAFSREYYFNKLRAGLKFYGNKLSEDEREVLGQFLGVLSPSNELLYAGLFYFNQVFFERAQAPMDLWTDPGYEKFRLKFKSSEEIASLFFKLLFEASQARVTTTISQQNNEATKIETKTKNWYDEVEAEKLGLESVKVPGHMGIQDLIERVYNRDHPGFADLSDSGDRTVLATLWNSIVKKDFAFPAVPPKSLWEALTPKLSYPSKIKNEDEGDWSYLISVQKGSTRRERFSYPRGEKYVFANCPNFGKEEQILVDKTPEYDFEDRSAATRDIKQTPLMKALGIVSDLRNVTVSEIERRLWQLEPRPRQGQVIRREVRSAVHKEVIKKLGLDPAKYYIRFMTVDEYIRLAKKKGYGAKRSWTIVEDSDFDIHNGKRHWHIGNSNYGGVSRIVLSESGSTLPYAIPRLVVAPLPVGADC